MTLIYQSIDTAHEDVKHYECVISIGPCHCIWILAHFIWVCFESCVNKHTLHSSLTYNCKIKVIKKCKMSQRTFNKSCIYPKCSYKGTTGLYKVCCKKNDSGSKILKYAFIEKSAIFTQPLQNLVKIRYLLMKSVPYFDQIS